MSFPAPFGHTFLERFFYERGVAVCARFAFALAVICTDKNMDCVRWFILFSHAFSLITMMFTDGQKFPLFPLRYSSLFSLVFQAGNLGEIGGTRKKMNKTFFPGLHSLFLSLKQRHQKIFNYSGKFVFSTFDYRLAYRGRVRLNARATSAPEHPNRSIARTQKTDLARETFLPLLGKVNKRTPNLKG